MSIKLTIQADFVTAMKEKNDTAKAALSGLKAKITEGEKANKNQDLTDEAIMKIINSAIKQRKDSAEAFTTGNRPELAQKELDEISFIEKYLPTQMTETEIDAAVRTLIPTLGGVPQNILAGKCMGAFNKAYPGRANAQVLKEVINRIVL